jgi:2-polyprenyl-3-methyl-5-hydroxy-6-metoxy-1,4-benzoquinol methylase
MSLMQLEEIACPRCGASRSQRVAVRADALAIVRCGQCRLAFVNPRPTPAEIEKLYGERYFQADVHEGIGYSDYPVSAQSIRATRPYLLDLLAESVPLGGRRSLDIGCAFGSLVYWMKRTGTEAVGVDINPRAVSWGRRELQLDLRCGTVEAIADIGGTFDVITAIDVIEHVPDLRSFMASTVSLLAPGGHLFVQTPNFAAYSTYGERCRFLSFSLEHLLYFEPDVLDATMAEFRLAPATSTRVLIQGPRASDDLVALMKGRTAAWRKLLRTLPIANALRRIRGWALPARRYRFDATGREGDIIVGVYVKAR